MVTQGLLDHILFCFSFSFYKVYVDMVCGTVLITLALRSESVQVLWFSPLAHA